MTPKENLRNKFDILKKRIMKHRNKCTHWKDLKPCDDCHINTLTPIEEAIELLY